MMSELSERLQAARAALAGHSCVAAKGDRLYISDERGIRPLMDWLSREDRPLEGASVADKVVGKAAALLFVRGGVGEIFAEVMSEAAVGALETHGVPYHAVRMVPRIINREGTGLCPMETRVLDTNSPEEAYIRLSAALAAMDAQARK